MYMRYDIIVQTSEFESSERETLKEPNGNAEQSYTLTKEEVLTKLLDFHMEKGKIFGVFWRLVDKGQRKQLTFHVPTEDIEAVDEELQYHGFGASGSQTVVIVNQEDVCDGYITLEMEKQKLKPLKQSIVGTLKAATGNLTVRKVLDSVRQKARISLDAIVHLISASILAAIGLGTNNTSVVVASMFLAPFTNPWNLMIFGIRIKDKVSVVYGCKIFFGYMLGIYSVGVIVGPFMQIWTYVHNIYSKDRYFRPYPTPEMSDRGNVESLCLGLAVASVSALSTYTGIINPRSDNVHVGNAISLSLVPPLVNAGMLTSHSIIAYVSVLAQNQNNCSYAYEICSSGSSDNYTEAIGECMNEATWMRTMLVSNSYLYDNRDICRIPRDFIIQGFVSFSVMAINVLMLLVWGLLLLWLQKFTPSRFGPKHLHSFYKYDLDQYRKTQGTIKTRDPWSTETFVETLKNEITENNRGLTLRDAKFIIETARRSKHYQSVVHPDIPTDSSRPSTPTISDHRVRFLSETQRTIRDTILSRDFDSSHPRRVRKRVVSGASCDGQTERRKSSNRKDSADSGDQTDPLRATTRRDSECVGRFQVTTALSAEA